MEKSAAFCFSGYLVKQLLFALRLFRNSVASDRFGDPRFKCFVCLFIRVFQSNHPCLHYKTVSLTDKLVNNGNSRLPSEAVY